MDLKYYKQYCANIENVENFEKAKADNFKGWCIHHRLQTWTSDGERRAVDITMDELNSLGMYYNRPAEELIFLTESEHQILHTKGKTLSDECKKKISEAIKGEKNGMYGKHHSEETKKKQSEAKKGHYTSEETRNKMSEAHKGENNSMYGKKHSDETKKKMGKSHKGNTNTKGMHWYHNDNGNIMAKECPPGYGPGRLKK